jgi:hypothetical protein
MAGDATKILIGAATVSIGPWVTAGGSGTLVDVGFTSGPVELTTKTTFYDAKAEQMETPAANAITEQSFQIKVPCIQGELEKLRMATQQPTANLAAKTLTIARPSLQYYQVQFVGKGPETGGTRTVTAYRCLVKDASPVSFGKGVEQKYELTLEAYQDPSIVTTANTVMKVVDA